MPASSMQWATPVGTEVDRHAERLEHVGRAARRRGLPVAVLAHLHARAGDDERGDRRHVDAACRCGRRRCRTCRRLAAAASSGTAASSMARTRPVISSARLALRAQGDEQPGDLAGVASPARTACSAACASSSGEVLAGQQPVERGRPSSAVQSHHRSRSSTPLAMRPSCTWRRALDDRELLGVAVVELGRVVLHVAGGAEQLQARRPTPSPPARWRSTWPSRGTAPTPW